MPSRTSLDTQAHTDQRTHTYTTCTCTYIQLFTHACTHTPVYPHAHAHAIYKHHVTASMIAPPPHSGIQPSAWGLCVLGHRRTVHLSTTQFLSSEANHLVQVSSPLVYVRIIWSARERSGSYIPSLEGLIQPVGLGYHLTTHCSANSPVLMHVSLRPHRGLMVKQKALQRKDAGICHGTCESEREPVLIRALNQKRQQS